MRIATFLLLVLFVQVSAHTFGQKVTLVTKNTPLTEVFRQIHAQTAYDFVFTTSTLSDAKPVTLNLQQLELADVLEQVFASQPLEYSVSDKSVVVTKKEKGDGHIGRSGQSSDEVIKILVLAYPEVRGRVVDSLGQPLEGASVRVLNAEGKRTTLQTKTDHAGYFVLENVPEDAQLEITYVGYAQRIINVESGMGSIVLKAIDNDLEEVEVFYQTGYQDIPKERATGSFTVINAEQIKRSVTTDILSRLEGVTNGLQFNRNTVSGETQEAPNLRVRGLSTIESNEDPLIVVDNFPFHGDINSINPNDIEQVTLLRDAAAASIWGAQAGNGVIVIVTKNGKFNQKAKFDVVSNVTIGEKPDLFYSPFYLPSDTIMAMQKSLFDRNLYNLNSPTIGQPLYADLLDKYRNNLISEEEFQRQESIYKNTDIRQQAMKYLYRPMVNQQYALSASGGSAYSRYYLSAGYDKSLTNVVGDENDRLNLNLQTTFRLLQDLEIGTGIWMTNQNARNNGLNLTDLKSAYGGMKWMPYAPLVNEDGSPAVIPQSVNYKYLEDPANAVLLDWYFRPLDELKHADKTSNTKEIRLTTHVNYRFLKYFNLLANYQYLQNFGTTREHYSVDTYYARNLINQYTQEDGTRVIPVGGILNDIPAATTVSHGGRAQLNYQQEFGEDHQVVALTGLELRQAVRQQLPRRTFYNYRDDILTANINYNYNQTYYYRPGGWSYNLPYPNSTFSKLTDRDLSYFGNVAYTYKRKYTISGSARYDGSNLFGVRTNQKGTPLWSVGGSWEISKEDFFRFSTLSYLRLRGTYGVSGNVNKSVTHYPTMYYMTNSYTNLPIGRLLSPGNPELRWERVNTFNIGADFEVARQRVRGSLEFYVKDGNELIGDDSMPPSTGMTNYKINYADIRTVGADLQLNWHNIKPKQQGSFGWSSMALASIVKNEVTNFNTTTTNRASNYLNSYSNTPVVGHSRDVLYAYPWHGLRHEDGMPIIYLNGEPSTNYNNYTNNALLEDLVVVGVTIPPYYGSFQNLFTWKNVQLDILLTWKAGYVFRRPSYNSGAENLVTSYGLHKDYFLRWQQPGDELITHVPASDESYNSYVNTVYANSEVLITKGDHIRLQDIKLSYGLPKQWVGRLAMNDLTLFLYARNLGIIWRSNKHDIDPDTPLADYPMQRTIAFGLNISL